MNLLRGVNRPVLRSFVWMFATLCMVALLAQPGSIQNEWSHVAGVWCGQGERDVLCPDIRTSNDNATSVLTNIVDSECWAKQTSPRLCPKSPAEQIPITLTKGTHPSLFNFGLSWLVLPSVELSVLVVRLANAFLLSVVLAVLSLLLPSQYRRTLALLIVAVLTAPGVFLLVSVNPLSWTTIGIGLGWLPLHAAIARNDLGILHRRILVAVGVLLFVLAVGSQRSALGFSIVVLALVTAHIGWLAFPNRRSALSKVLVVPLGALFVALEFVSPRIAYSLFLSSFDSSGTASYEAALSSFDYLRDLLPVVPSAVRSLFGFPAWNPVNPLLLTVSLPEIVMFGGVGLLGYLVVRSTDLKPGFQAGGAGFVLFVAALVLFAQVSSQEKVDYSMTDTLAVYPLIVFLAGWWFFLAPNEQSESLVNSLHSFAVIATALFAITSFTVAERFVDRQSFGLRYLPEGMDQWWWTGMPVGPNVVVVLAPICLWRFLSAYIPIVKGSRNSLERT